MSYMPPCRLGRGPAWWIAEAVQDVGLVIRYFDDLFLLPLYSADQSSLLLLCCGLATPLTPMPKVIIIAMTSYSSYKLM